MSHQLARPTLGIAALAIAMTMGAAASRADPVSFSTFDFSGICQDCATVGTAQLVLSDYTPGDAITIRNFVSFAYGGTNLLAPFSIDTSQASGLAGSVGAPDASAQDFTVLGNGENFTSQTNGFWCVGQACYDDLGFDNTWSLVSADASPTDMPEPTGIAILGVGVVGVALRRRSERRLPQAPHSVV